MSTSQAAHQHASDRPETDPRSLCHEHHDGLEAESHTTQRLRNASAHHLYMTSRRYFIGPIPEFWLQNHRKSWYKARLNFKDYSSRATTFAADPVVEHYRENPPDRGEASSPAPGQDPTLSDGTERETTDEDETDERRERETTSAPEVLQTISYPLEAEDPPQPSESETVQPLERNQSNPDYLSADTRREPSSAYFTAMEYNPVVSGAGQSSANESAPGRQPKKPDRLSLNTPSVRNRSQESSATPASEPESTRALLKHKQPRSKRSDHTAATLGTLEQQEPQNEDSDGNDDPRGKRRADQDFLLSPVSNRMTKYNVGDNLLDKRHRIRARISRAHEGISAKRPGRRKMQEGEIVKAERMLVQVEETIRKQVPENYTEIDSMSIGTRIVDKWREFLVVCRKIGDEHAPFSIQMYKTRVIPEVQKPGTKAKPYHEIQLNRKRARVNLYSSLDKSLAIWGPRKHGTNIYIMRPKSAAHATEWHAFVLELLGWSRPSSLPISVPDLGVSLIFKNPFAQLSSLGAEGGHRQDDRTFNGVAANEGFAAIAIIRECLAMLEDRPQWAEVLKEWSKTEKMGLAWKRYDRLEWLFGVNEKMYGSIAMSTSHELELRPRHHYPTALRHKDGKEEEPRPVEGFLVRLTSHRGVHQRMNMMFFKRLYFFTQDRYLFFTRPSKSMPPPPPKMTMDESSVPSTREILDKMPLSYEINPYPLQNGEIAWLPSGNREFVKRQDEGAYAHAQRNIHNLAQADGHIDLCRVREVRQVQLGSSPADSNIQQGADVEFNHEPRDTRRDDGATGQFDDDKTFEMLLDNGLVIRLQAYNRVTRDEWIERLSALVRYWRARCAADAAELKAIRQRNVDLLNIDEEMESFIGQLGRKWELKRAEASPHLHNICNLFGCRTIKMSGALYLKPRRHATFKQCSVILTAGKLLIFRSTLRKRSGVEVPQIYQELETSLELDDCYIYSGLLTDSDLLYANQTFDSNRPGLHAMPRIYLSTDVYTSCDEDTAISFVLWQPLQKAFFRSRELGKRGKTKQTLRHVSKLGVHGRTTVFKARSRVEKDRWVLSISSEIDRLQESKREEDMRIVTP